MNFNAQATHQQLVYLYDLPKEDMTSVKIATAFKEIAGIVLTDPKQKPQIKKDITKPFYTAMVNIQDPDQYKTACDKMRYFNINDKPCRGLAFDKQLLGSNKEKLLAHNVFVKVPRNILHEELHKIFEQFGPVKSLKVSLTPEYDSNGYGFICFENSDSAGKALEASEAGKLPKDVQAFMFKPRDNKSAMRKLINNIYVKNLPTGMSDDAIKKLFEPYGTIKSMFLKESQFGRFGFVCYDDPEGKSKEYGPACASKAIEALNEKDVEGNKLVVRCALSKLERDAEKKRETIRYKTSKKRCNLFVKNFPPTWKKENIEKMFSQFGEIEKVRLDQGKSGNAFAFVCFKEPNDAAKAKQNLHNHNVEGKTLNICYYEIKEIRQIQNEEAKDKADWERYQAQQTGGFQWNELTNLPNLSHILTTLMQVIHAHEQQNAQNNQQSNMQGGGYKHHRGQRQGQPHPRAQMGGQNFQQNMPQNMGNPMQQMQNQPMVNNMGMPPPNMNQAMPRQQMPQPNMPMAPQNTMPMNPSGGQGNSVQNYLMRTQKILPAVDERNPHLKGQVGECIYDFIVEMIGAELAPKITGMLIDLPVNQIKQYLQSYDALSMKVHEARDHLTQRMDN